MPLVRLEVRNAFGAGHSHPPPPSSDDPKAVLDGLAVSGLVGLLRQLGDLAEFAAQVFHGLQEEVMTASARSHHLAARVRRIEAALPPLEKLVLAQTSHIHFAYTPGLEWHPRIRSRRNHFLADDLPRFIMDSYEECRAPPRLHLLDKFDTGGAGSCLKRYSDPSFFKRMSSVGDEAVGEKGQRHTKARWRNKKKRASKQSGGDVSVSHGASVSTARNHGFIPPIVDGHSSPSHTASTVDLGLRYDPRDDIHSFNSRIESGYIECVFRPSCSTQAEDQEPKDSPRFNVVRHSDATTGSASPGERAGFVVDDNVFPRSSLQESKSRESDVDETLYTYQNEPDSPVVHQMQIHGDESYIRESVSTQNGIEEIDSEPDDFMDALNTIESEAENDINYRMRCGLEQFSSISNTEETDGIDELAVPCSDPPPTYESRSDSLVSSNKDVVPDLPDLILSESCDHFCADKQLTSDHPNPGSSEIHTFEEVFQRDRDSFAGVRRSSDVRDGPESESVIAETSFSASRPTDDIQDQSGDKAAVSSNSEPHESPTDVSSSSSVKIWTNGGLLGLMPSKPPDFSMASPVTRDSMNGGQVSIVGAPASAYGNASGLHMQNGLGVYRGSDLNEASVPGTGKVLPVSLNAKYRSTETGQDNDESSSLVFGLSRRLLSNGFGRKLPDMDDGKFEPAISVNNSILGKRNNQLVPETLFQEQFGYGTTAISPTASPPLEHMKISFLPVDGLEASKLKLRFSDGTQSHERIRDMFPTFQLIPNASVRRRDYASDSDDDTFCRSSPFMSDDCRSRQSESNSEQWECDEANEAHDDNIYDALRGISSMELVPRSLELDGIPSNSVSFNSGVKGKNSGIDTESSIRSPVLDLPSFDAVKPSLHRETNNDSDSVDVGDSSPMPPPLPPVQWRASKPHLDVVEEKPDVAPEAFTHALVMEFKQASKPTSDSLQRSNSELTVKQKMKEDEQKWNRQSEPNHSSNGKGTDDFLQQIRSKSFNLRRTVTEKPTIASGPPASVNVTAILEKANAIRQAVGSDDGDDDTWSDT